MQITKSIISLVLLLVFLGGCRDTSDILHLPNLEPPPLTVSIPSYIRFSTHYTGDSTLTYEFSPQIPGFIYNSSSVFYTGSGKVPKEVELNVTVSDGKYRDKKSLLLKIVASEPSELVWEKDYFYVEDQDARFHVAQAQPAVGFEISFNGLSHFPDAPEDVTRLSPNFRLGVAEYLPFGTPIDSALEIAVLWPMEKLAKRGNVNRAELYVYSQQLGRWAGRSHFPELTMHAGKEWFELKYVRPNTVSFIGLHRDLANPNASLPNPNQ